jgi:prepilin-type N-terminal cleavage/methylation domain-containing protein
MRGRRTAAFTLVELMVTVAIVALLIGIMVPSARAIQRESRNTGCLNNLRQCFTGVDAWRQQNGGLVPMCEFLPVVTDTGIDGGLPNLLAGYLPADSPAWTCPSDDDEESLATGTSYVYLPGLLRYTPAVQVDVATLLASFDPATVSMQQLENARRESESRAMTEFFEREPASFPLLIDSQDRHRRVGSERNGVFLDGSARMAALEPEPDPEGAQ